MAVKLRLTRVGKTKQPQYRIVAADRARRATGGSSRSSGSTTRGRSRRSSTSTPTRRPSAWRHGAQPTERVAKLLEIAGVELPAKVAARVKPGGSQKKAL